MKLDGNITLLIGQDDTSIQIYDDLSNLMICEVTLTPEQLSSALSRLARTPCKVEVYPSKFERIGRKMEVDKLEFEAPPNARRDDARLYLRALDATPDGWTPDDYFGSQDSFFVRDGKEYARCTIRRWIQEGEQTPQPDSITQ